MYSLGLSEDGSQISGLDNWAATSGRDDECRKGSAKIGADEQV